ncbi:MAG TPA: 4,5-dihydroxyphthalate decarboxylase [Firmicutes bacterium]|nr:4,5-dihydroxyphthalate decarboxylase [Bacillota bacterium]
MTFILDSIIGMVACLGLFYQLKKLNSNKAEKITQYPSISMIIPARNEEKTLPCLLSSLQSQKNLLKEIIVVDDHSHDRTKEMAASFGVTVIEALNKDDSWVGKSYACLKGSEVASGDVYLFVDADTVFADGALSKLIKTYMGINGVLSLQPYHRVTKWFEQCSLYFNLILVGGMHSFSCFSNAETAIGLFGPLIMIDAKLYKQIKGHESVKDKVIEDLALGQVLKQNKIKLYNYIGYDSISFKMYDHVGALIEGWTKNFALGAKTTNIRLFLMTFIWITQSLSVFFNLVNHLISHKPFGIILLFYILYVGQLYFISKQLGSFKHVVLVMYPIYILIFIAIFIYSSIKTFIFKKVNWKGRPIKV